MAVCSVKGERLLEDIVRYLFWIHFREVVDLDSLAMLRALSVLIAKSGWLVESRHRDVLVEELRRTFAEHNWTARSLDATIQLAKELHAQCLVEELLLDDLSDSRLEKLIVVEGKEHLDEANERGSGVLVLFPQAGNTLLLLTALSQISPKFAAVSLRSFPPLGHPIVGRRRLSRWSWRVRRSRSANHRRIGVKLLAPKAVSRQREVLQEGGILAFPVDGRFGTAFLPTPFLGRVALLSAIPWEVAAATGAAVVPAVCVRNPDRTHRLILGESSSPSDFPANPTASLQAALTNHIEPWLTRHPELYASWLQHCRLYSQLDDFPMFEDQARSGRPS